MNKRAYIFILLTLLFQTFNCWQYEIVNCISAFFLLFCLCAQNLDVPAHTQTLTL